jgi:DNA-binding NarL/FixJ family response regulator
MIRVLVADDHTVVRRGVKQILSEAPDIVVVGEASTAHEAIRAVRQERFDVLVLDIAMPEGGGLEVLSQLRGLETHPRVLILSMYPEKQYALRALKSGASGYLTKESASEELVAAVRTIAQGGRYVTQALAETMADELGNTPGQAPHDRLSDRECQVMCLVAGGKTVTEVATELSLSAKTVSTYRARILTKLGVSNNAEIVRYAFQHGLVD